MTDNLEKRVSCPVETALQAIGGKWKCVILWFLRDKPYRTGELKRQIPGISEKMLIQQLRGLEKHGVVERQVFQEVPPRVEYSLTPHGRGLEPALEALCQWGKQHEKWLSRRTSMADESA